MSSSVSKETVAPSEMRDALVKYGDHVHSCQLNRDPDFGRCSCGFTDLILRVIATPQCPVASGGSHGGRCTLLEGHTGKHSNRWGEWP